MPRTDWRCAWCMKTIQIDESYWVFPDETLLCPECFRGRDVRQLDLEGKPLPAKRPQPNRRRRMRVPGQMSLFGG